MPLDRDSRLVSLATGGEALLDSDSLSLLLDGKAQLVCNTRSSLKACDSPFRHLGMKGADWQTVTSAPHYLYLSVRSSRGGQVTDTRSSPAGGEELLENI